MDALKQEGQGRTTSTYLWIVSRSELADFDIVAVHTQHKREQTLKQKTTETQRKNNKSILPQITFM